MRRPEPGASAWRPRRRSAGSGLLLTLATAGSMWPAEDVKVTFLFARAGAATATVPVAAPVNPVPPAPTAEPSTIPGADRA